MANQSSAERKFAYYWRILGSPDFEYVEQHRFHPTRKWRLDFSWEKQMVAAEIDGGTWLSKHGKKGGHTTGVGYQKDCEKANAAVTLGWRVFRFTPSMLDANPSLCINQILEVLGDKTNESA